MTVATGEGLQHAFFTHPSHGALHVNAQKKPVDNRDLWERLIALVEQHDVTWHKVAGHSGTMHAELVVN